MNRRAVLLLTVVLLVPQAGAAKTAAPSPSSPPAASGPSSPPSPGASATPAPLSADADAPVLATLANGMRVVLLRDTLAPVVTTYMAYGVGSDDDTQTGIAHATEHMMFRGTTDLSGGQLADIAARMGAEYNAATTDTFTLYYYKVPATYVDVVLQIEADRMTHATMRAADWATERGAIEQEIRGHESQPTYRIGTKLRELFFAGTPLATASGGTVPGFEKLTADQIRAFYTTWYQPGNATLVVAGNIDLQRTLAAVHREFDPIPAGAIPLRSPLVVPPLPTSTVHDTIDFPVGLGVLAYRLPGSNAPDYAASEVLAQVLAGGRSAFADLTASGKTLAVVSNADALPQLGALYIIAIPGPAGTPESTQRLLTGVIDTYRAGGVPVDLIEDAKTRLLSEQTYRRASIAGLGFSWAEATAQRHTTPDAIYAAIATVTPDDVNRVLRTYLTSEHVISIVIAAKPSTGMPHIDASAANEHVGFTPTVHEPLPAWAQAALSAPLRAPDDAVQTSTTLPNGLRLMVRRETASPTVVVSGVIRTSPQLYEPHGKDGVSLLVDGMLPWGTQTYDRKEYQAQVDAIAGTIALGTTFSLTIQSKDFERGMQLLADGLLHPAFAPNAFAIVKANTIQTVAVDEKLPHTQAELAQRLALYQPGDPRRREATEATLGAVSLDDLKRYYRFAYRPDETTLAIVGDVGASEAKRVVAATFGSWRANGPAPNFLLPRLPLTATRAQTVRVRSATNVDSEVTLSQVFAMRRTDVDYVPLLLANTILSGEGTGSLLMEELRTRRGSVYEANSNFGVDRTGARFSISYASAPKDVAATDAAIVAIIKRLQSRPLPVIELQRAKALLLAQRVLPLDSYRGVATDMLAGAADGYATDGSDRWFWTALLQTTPAQLQHAVRRIDPSRFLRVIIEPDQ